MMDITKSREEFEAWLKSKMPTIYRLAFECSDDDELTNFAKASALDMQTGWLASRESIEVELPEIYSNGVPKCDEYDRAISECSAVLRTAGIRIKGESE